MREPAGGDAGPERDGRSDRSHDDVRAIEPEVAPEAGDRLYARAMGVDDVFDAEFAQLARSPGERFVIGVEEMPSADQSSRASAGVES